jgi:hypothetical protein
MMRWTIGAGHRGAVRLASLARADEEPEMNDAWFDRIDWRAAGLLPRRAFGLSALAALGGALFPASGEGKRRCRRRNQGCNRNRQCCTGVCGPLFEGPHPLGLCRATQCGNPGSPCQSDADCCQVRCSTVDHICGT